MRRRGAFGVSAGLLHRTRTRRALPLCQLYDSRPDAHVMDLLVMTIAIVGDVSATPAYGGYWQRLRVSA